MRMIFQSSEKYEDFLKWSYCNGQPTKVKNSKIFRSGLIVMGDLHRWKNAKILQDGLIVIGELLW